MDIHNMILLWSALAILGVFVFYIDPGTFVPLVSILAAIAGALLIAWRYVIALVKKIVRRISRTSAKK